MVVKELRQALQQPFFLIPFILVHALALGALGLEWLSIQEKSGASHITELKTIEGNAFWWVAILVVSVVMPLRGFSAIREEMNGNVHFLIITGITRWRIVMGKWKVQMQLALLTLASLFPYMLVRYFFGAFNLVTNVLLLITCVALTGANTAVVLGTSGYQNLFPKLMLLGVLGLYNTIVSLFLVSLSSQINTAGFGTTLTLGYVILILLSMLLYFTLIGLQLARGHLKLFLVPWEISPTRSTATMGVLAPLLFIAGAAVTLLVGMILAMLLLCYAVLVYDRTKPRKPIKGPLQMPNINY